MKSSWFESSSMESDCCGGIVLCGFSLPGFTRAGGDPCPDTEGDVSDCSRGRGKSYRRVPRACQLKTRYIVRTYNTT